MSSTNIVVISGRLGQTPELRHTKSGIAVSRISLAIEPAKRLPDPRQPEQKIKGTPAYVPFDDGTYFVDCTLWRQVAVNAVKWLTVGRLVVVEGHLSINQFENKLTGKSEKRLNVTGDVVRYMDKGTSVDVADDDVIPEETAPVATTPAMTPAEKEAELKYATGMAEDQCSTPAEAYLGMKKTKRTSNKPKATL